MTGKQTTIVVSVLLGLSLIVYFTDFSKGEKERINRYKIEKEQKIITECGSRDGFFSKNRDLKCAIKAGEANTEYAAQRIISDC
jgi:hypothetical protein